MKLTINKLIANDMINYSLEQAKGNRFIMNLNKYLSDFDDDSIDYITKNIDVINKDLEYSADLEDLSIIGSGNSRRYNMLFNSESILDREKEEELENAW